MRHFENIDYDFRPASYEEDPGTLAAILRNIKGEGRRHLIRELAARGQLDDLDPEFLSIGVSEATREMLGRIHPALAAGELLPDYLPGEVEIARLVVHDSVDNLLSLRARPDGSGGYLYRIATESGTPFVLPLPSSPRPLTLEELIEQFTDGNNQEGDLDGGLALGFNNEHALWDGEMPNPAKLTAITSEIYPQLQAHFAEVFALWAAEQAPGGEDDSNPPFAT